ncbi:hypothetical protein HYFRA_00003544 [Hymenoscyphus fraxineus]|uniref:Uncharacterized protein n=1 Tax=Hymenoscyphus fraxineus TaxID=746836 RepID=A0A9N9PSF3_9HELO|nr:hypothetical protein HYFRA_00003544 [Hymenoscyphus fraxineus]
MVLEDDEDRQRQRTASNPLKDGMRIQWFLRIKRKLNSEIINFRDYLTRQLMGVVRRVRWNEKSNRGFFGRRPNFPTRPNATHPNSHPIRKYEHAESSTLTPAIPNAQSPSHRRFPSPLARNLPSTAPMQAPDASPIARPASQKSGICCTSRNFPDQGDPIVCPGPTMVEFCFSSIMGIFVVLDILVGGKTVTMLVAGWWEGGKFPGRANQSVGEEESEEASEKDENYVRRPQDDQCKARRLTLLGLFDVDSWENFNRSTPTMPFGRSSFYARNADSTTGHFNSRFTSQGLTANLLKLNSNSKKPNTEKTRAEKESLSPYATADLPKNSQESLMLSSPA